MSIHTNEEFEKLKAIGKIVRWSLDEMSAAVRSGLTTLELDHIGLRMLKQHGAEAAPPKVYGFPGSVCISVNDEAVHGVPGGRILREGDLVKLDLVAMKDGLFADAAMTIRVGKVSNSADALVRCAEAAFWRFSEIIIRCSRRHRGQLDTGTHRCSIQKYLRNPSGRSPGSNRRMF